MIYIAFGLNAAMFLWNLKAAWRLVQLTRNAHALNRLLASLCCQAFAARYIPIWTAWTAVMGDISVEVKQTRKEKE